MRNTFTKGAALSIAAATTFITLYKSIDLAIASPEEANISCWGANSCKGQTSCATAFNACAGQNECKGRGILNLSTDECAKKGGVPLEGSEGDPSN